MNLTAAAPAARYPLRLVRGTTGTVHAGREYEAEVLDFSAPTVEARHTGRFQTRTEKACGFDSNTMRRISGTGVGDAGAEVTCKKCIKVLAN
jgi:hypothetical protein